jgi:hypothetical protein
LTASILTKHMSCLWISRIHSCYAGICVNWDAACNSYPTIPYSDKLLICSFKNSSCF